VLSPVHSQMPPQPSPVAALVSLSRPELLQIKLRELADLTWPGAVLSGSVAVPVPRGSDDAKLNSGKKAICELCAAELEPGWQMSNQNGIGRICLHRCRQHSVDAVAIMTSQGSPATMNSG
jgi:hypothetical protein